MLLVLFCAAAGHEKRRRQSIVGGRCGCRISLLTCLQKEEALHFGSSTCYVWVASTRPTHKESAGSSEERLLYSFIAHRRRRGPIYFSKFNCTCGGHACGSVYFRGPRSRPLGPIPRPCCRPQSSTAAVPRLSLMGLGLGLCLCLCFVLVRKCWHLLLLVISHRMPTVQMQVAMSYS